jgi:hypothetical protein
MVGKGRSSLYQPFASLNAVAWTGTAPRIPPPLRQSHLEGKIHAIGS